MVAPPGGIMPALPGALPMANPLLANPLLMPGLPGGTAVSEQAGWGALDGLRKV